MMRVSIPYTICNLIFNISGKIAKISDYTSIADVLKACPYTASVAYKVPKKRQKTGSFVVS